MADRLAHPPHLAVAALVDGDPQHARARLGDPGRRGHAVVQLDAVAEAANGAGSGRPSRTSPGSSSAPALLYEEPELVVRVVRDLFNEDFHELVIQGTDAYESVEPYLSHASPDLVDRVRRYTGVNDVFADLRIDEQLIKALDRRVFLPSGGSLVIDRTEAMTVIDVNTGKYTGAGGNLEETVTRNNLEAAEEIVHQLRLRDLGGIIVIDFIDMVLVTGEKPRAKSFLLLPPV